MTELAEQVYDRLWNDGQALFQAGRVKTDPYLLTWKTDTRRGLTLVARPDAATRDRIAALIDDLRAIIPEQYLYQPNELHITVLSLVSAAPDFAPNPDLLDRWQVALTDALREVTPFELSLRGVVASPDCVLVCGYDESGALGQLRDKLRRELPFTLRGTMEQRYRSVTAHLSIARFQSQPEQLPELIDFLNRTRSRDFGFSQVTQLEYTFNDWYMSHQRTQLITRYHLGRSKQECDWRF